MNSKKLFAILTLVAFMMTLVPMAAFGVAYSSSASYITTDKDSTGTSDSTVDRPIKLTLFARNSAGEALVSKTLNNIYLKVDNDAVKVGVLTGNQTATATDDVSNTPGTLSTGKVVYRVTDADMISANGAQMELKTDANGRVVFYVYSKIGGTATLKFYDDAVDAASDELLIAQKTLTFEASAATVNGVKFITQPAASSDNGAGTEITLKAQVYDASNNGIQGKDVKFFVKKGTSASYVSIGTITSDDIGEAELKYTPTEAKDSYTVKVECGEKSKVSNTFDVVAASPIKIEAKDASKYVEKSPNKIAFYMYDAYGNKNYDAAKIEVKCTADPADSGKESTTALTEGVDTTNKRVYAFFTPDVDGEYTIKATIANTGISAVSKLTAGVFGTVTGVTVKLADDDDIGIKTTNDTTPTRTRLVASVANANQLRIKLIDENGLEKAASASDTILMSSNTDMVSFEDTNSFGKAFGPMNNTKGKATITAIHTDTGISGTLEIDVVGSPAAIDETVVTSDKTASVTLQMKDTQGVNTFFGADKDYNVYTPTGVTVDTKNLIDDKKGLGTFTLTSDSYGEKTITVAIADGLAKSFTVNFTEPVPVIEGAAQKVTMFIGNTGYVQDGSAAVTDVAPFIQNSRTFVAVRPLANAFGAEIGWDEATQTVTLTRADKTVTIVIGSSTVTVVSNGVTSTVTADEPAFIKDGRTVLPFRAVGEAFGYTVSYDAATQAVSYSL